MEPRRGRLAFVFAIGVLRHSVLAQQVNCPIFHEEPRCGENEIGANLFSWINIDLDNGVDGNGDQRIANGLLYKLHRGKNAWRVGIDVFREHYVIGTSLGPGGNYPTGHGYREGRVSDGRIRLGYQRSFGKGKVDPFVGMDVGFRYVSEEYDFEGNGDFIYNPSWGSGTETLEQPFIAPLFGLSYRVMKHWSFTIEAAFTFVKGRSESTRSEHSFIAPDERAYSYSQAEQGILVDPLRTVAVSYLF